LKRKWQPPRGAPDDTKKGSCFQDEIDVQVSESHLRFVDLDKADETPAENIPGMISKGVCRWASLIMRIALKRGAPFFVGA
jgi:hypothetical protein